MTTYYYDGWRVLTEFEDPDVGASVERDFIWGNYLDEALMMGVDNTTDYYYAHDHLYSPVALINSSGSVIERYEYDAYGSQQVMDSNYNTRSSSSYSNAIAFTGQRLDSLDSGDLPIMYYKNRYYHLDMGRFVTRDILGMRSIGFKTNNLFMPLRQYSDGANLFAFLLSNPLNNLDADGLKCGDCNPPADPTKNAYNPRPVALGFSQGIASPKTVEDGMDLLDNIGTGLDWYGKIPDEAPKPPIGVPGYINEGLNKAKKALNYIHEKVKDQKGFILWIKIEYEKCVPCWRRISLNPFSLGCALYTEKTYSTWHKCKVPEEHSLKDYDYDGRIWSAKHDVKQRNEEMYLQMRTAVFGPNPKVKITGCIRSAMLDPAKLKNNKK